MTLENILSEFLEIHSVGIKTNTVRMYQSCENYINVYMGNLDILDINFLQIQKFLNHLYQDKKLSKSTISKYLILLRIVFNYAIQLNLITINPCTTARVPKNANVNVRIPLNSNEIKIIINEHKSEYFNLYAYIMLFTGLRKSEMLGLQMSDVDFDTNTITINRTVIHERNKPVIYNTLKNGTQSKVIPLISKVKTVLKPMNNSGFLFGNENGLAFSEIQLRRRWDTYRRNVKLNITQHQIRHTYCTMLYNAGVDVKTAQYLMGHKDIKMTLNIYTHLDEFKKLSNSNLIEHYIDNTYFN